MSRHRAIRNLNLDEELAEDDYSDEDPYVDLSAEDNDAMIEAFAQTLDVVGPMSSNGFEERQIKDALWDAYFDVDTAVTQLVEDKSRKEAKAEKDRLKQGESFPIPSRCKAAEESDGSSRHVEMGDQWTNPSEIVCHPAFRSTRPSLPDNDLDATDQEALVSLHSLSLSNRREQIRRGRGMPGGKAQGLRGLAMGGRSGMAKRNLASLAPEHLQQHTKSSTPPFALRDSNSSKPVSKLAALAARSSAKRPAEQPPPVNTSASSNSDAEPVSSSGIVVNSSRPSKLAALAAARSAGSPRPSPVTTLNTAPETVQSTEAGPSKPLSKLQQRMQASRQQRNAGPEDIAAAKAHAAEQEAESIPKTCYGSLHDITTLFPAASHSNSGEQHPRGLLGRSTIAGTGEQTDDQLVAPLSKSIPVPGGSPFDLFVSATSPAPSSQLDVVKRAFQGPSPDDVVLKAREGTTLAKRS